MKTENGNDYESPPHPQEAGSVEKGREATADHSWRRKTHLYNRQKLLSDYDWDGGHVDFGDKYWMCRERSHKGSGIWKASRQLAS